MAVSLQTSKASFGADQQTRFKEAIAKAAVLKVFWVGTFYSNYT
jgi:hypothetical protein